LKRFFEDLLRRYAEAPEEIEKGCSGIRNLVERAEKLLSMLVVECVGVCAGDRKEV